MIKGIEYDLALEEREEDVVRYEHHGVWVPPRLVGGAWVQDGMIPSYMEPGPQVGERWARPVAAFMSGLMIGAAIVWRTLFQ